MQRFTVSRDDRYHEAWPTVCIAANGDLVCSYSEGDVHGGGAVPSAVVRISEDEGATWSDPIIVDTLLDRPRSGFFMCRAVIRLRDGSLLLAADWDSTDYVQPPGTPGFWRWDPSNDVFGEVWLYRSFDDGRTWSGPERTGCLAVSVTAKQISDGTILLCASQYNYLGRYWSQFVHRSNDDGKTWSDPILVAGAPGGWFAEGDVVEMPGGELVMYMRSQGVGHRPPIGSKAISRDGGLTWDGPYAAGKWPVTGRVAAGRLSSGEALVMHRVGGFTLQHPFGFFVESAETALARIPYDHSAPLDPPAGSRWGIIDNDTSPYADHGYGGWVELPSGDVYAVNYIVDDAPRHRAQIRGYRISRDELLNPNRGLAVDFQPPTYKRGKLEYQDGWVPQKPEFWHTRGSRPGKPDPLGNYVLVDVSGQHSFWGTASITGSRNAGGEEQVLRRDVGPYDLRFEDLEITVTHTGRQNCGIFRVLDAKGQTIVQLRSDYLQDSLWTEDPMGLATVSDVSCDEGFWETRLSFSQHRLTISTRPAGEVAFDPPWCTIPLRGGDDSDTADCRESAMSASMILVPVVSALVVALGEQGGLYIDRIEIRTVEPEHTPS